LSATLKPDHGAVNPPPPTRLTPTSDHSGCIDISYSRSSGPGGQNVNKVSTKATVRLALAATRPWYPPYALAALVRSPHFTASTPLSTKNPSPAAQASHPPEPSGALLVSASEHRTQPQNLASALAKLKVALVGAARVGLVGETSAEQKERVKGLVARDKRKVENVKRQRKDVKTGRRAGKGGWD